jgi:hypothetical protein
MNRNDLPHPADKGLARTLSRHLNDYAVGVDSMPDPDAIRRGMQKVDRNRRIRTIGAGGCMVAVLAIGFLTLGGGDHRAGSDLDVRGEAPAPPPEDPSLGPGAVEQTDAGERTTEGPDDPAGPAVASGNDSNEDNDSSSNSNDIGDGGYGSSEGIDRVVDGDGSGVPDHLQVAPIATTAPAETTATTRTTTTAPPPPPTTTTPPPPTTTTGAVSFAAYSQYGSCEEDPPYDEYSGTATPGTNVTITSRWSAPAQTTADGTGHWYIRVEFPDAPVGDVFTVVASDGTADVGMSFVRTA